MTDEQRGTALTVFVVAVGVAHLLWLVHLHRTAGRCSDCADKHADELEQLMVDGLVNEELVHQAVEEAFAEIEGEL